MDGYYEEPLHAFLRARLEDERPLAELLELARQRGVRVHRFKKTTGLPRVLRVLGILHGLAPESLLDLGTGRGVFLWPLLEEFPRLPVTAVDLRPDRVQDLQAVGRGGVDRLTAACQDIRRLSFEADTFDVVTALEVLEHLPDPAPAAREAVRVARRFVVASAPSHEDDNPEHVQLFTRESFARLFQEAGASRVSVDYVLNHMIAVARKG